jgi:hypothetical protein
VTRRLLVVAACFFACAPAALAATTGASVPEFDGQGRLVETPFAPPVTAAHLTKAKVYATVLRNPKVAAWLDR